MKTETFEFDCPECGDATEIELKPWEFEFNDKGISAECVECCHCCAVVELEIMAEPYFTYTIQNVALG